MARMKAVIKWNKGAFAEIRTLPKVMEALNAEAKSIAQKAGPNYEAKPAQEAGGRIRGRASVVTKGIDGIRDNRRNHTLSKFASRKKG